MFETGVTERPIRTHAIKVHGPEGFEGMRRAGRLAAECLDMLIPHVKPGVLTETLDDLAREFILDHGALPACLGYKGFTRTVCISPNHVVCHGIPGPRALREGDIANIDVTVIVEGGWHGDTSRMYGVGEVSARSRRLCDITYEAMLKGIAQVKPGARFGDIGYAIQQYVEGQRASVVRDFCGHGLGQVFHDAPNVLHFGSRGEGRPEARHVLHHRTDGEPWPPAGEGAERRLDGGDPRQVPLGPVRAFGGRHRRRRGDLHPVSHRPVQAADAGRGLILRQEHG
jgi:methionyl aminopeptidase